MFSSWDYMVMNDKGAKGSAVSSSGGSVPRRRTKRKAKPAVDPYKEGIIPEHTPTAMYKFSLPRNPKREKELLNMNKMQVEGLWGKPIHGNGRYDIEWHRALAGIADREGFVFEHDYLQTTQLRMDPLWQRLSRGYVSECMCKEGIIWNPNWEENAMKAYQKWRGDNKECWFDHPVSSLMTWGFAWMCIALPIHALFLIACRDDPDVMAFLWKIFGVVSMFMWVLAILGDAQLDADGMKKFQCSAHYADVDERAREECKNGGRPHAPIPEDDEATKRFKAAATAAGNALKAMQLAPEESLREARNTYYKLCNEYELAKRELKRQELLREEME